MFRLAVLSIIFVVVLVYVSNFQARRFKRKATQGEVFLGLIVAATLVYFLSGIGEKNRIAERQYEKAAEREAFQARRAKEYAPLDDCGGDGSSNPAEWRWREYKTAYYRGSRKTTKGWGLEYADTDSEQVRCLPKYGPSVVRMAENKDSRGQVACPGKAPIWPHDETVGGQLHFLNKILSDLGVPPATSLHPLSKNSDAIWSGVSSQDYPLGTLQVRLYRNQFRYGSGRDCWLVAQVLVSRAYDPSKDSDPWADWK